jgi:ribose/xylose/arabinose/galactoside ABC-type transport system permease subunit
LISTNAQNVTAVSIHPALQFMSASRLGIFPVPGLIFIGIAALAQLCLSLTRFGRALYAAGWKPEAAELSGIRISRLRIVAYLISALLAALAGMLIACRVLSVKVLSQQLDSGGTMFGRPARLRPRWRLATSGTLRFLGREAYGGK